MNAPVGLGPIDRHTRIRPVRALTFAGLVSALVLAGCATSPASSASPPATDSLTPPTGSATAPDSTRVDLGLPTFSNPTAITNALFPRVGITQVIQLGAEGEEKLRFEITQLPETKVIEWDGMQIETSVTHFMAYGSGRILEVARDFYAQADDGSVWYFGEDVFNYEDGVVANNEGTWLAGRDGPPGMIMPADPQVGDVYRPENIPDLVFEEVTVMSAGETLDAPRGTVSGAVLVQEHLMDGTIEDKAFAPGYGEFRAEVASLDELYGVAFAAPIDAVGGTVPDELTMLAEGAAELHAATVPEDWSAIGMSFDSMSAAWTSYGSGDLSERLVGQMTDAIDALGAAIEAQEAGDVRQAAMDVAGATLDFELAFRPIADVDVDRLELWSRQLQIDTAAADPALVLGDVATLEAIWERVAHAVDSTAGAAIDAGLAEVRSAADAEELDRIPDVATALLAAFAGLDTVEQ